MPGYTTNAAELEHIRAAHISAAEKLDAAEKRMRQRMRTQPEWEIVQLIAGARADLDRAKTHIVNIHPNGVST